MTRRLLILAAVTGLTLAGANDSAIATDFGWDRAGGDNLWGNVVNWNPNKGPGSADNLILDGASLDGPQIIDLGGTERLINRIEANGVVGTYTLVNGASADPLRIFLASGNALFANGGSSLVIDANLQLESAAVLRFNADTAGGQIIVNGNVTPGPLAVGTTTLELTSRNSSVDPIIRVAGVIADGPSAVMALTAGNAGDASNHRGIVSVTGMNTYTGRTAVNGATLVFNSIGDVGDGPSALGAPTTVATGTINVGAGATMGTLRYVGAGHSSDRVINLVGTMGSSTISASGTGALVLTGGITAGASFTLSKTLALDGASTADNEISGVIQDVPGTGLLSVKKLSGGTWILSAANTYTGQTFIQDGTLVVNSLADIGADSSSLGAPVNAPSATIEIGSGTSWGTLRYLGPGHSSNRPIRMAGSTGFAVIEASGTGPLVLTGNITAAAGVKELRVGGTGVGDNTLAGTFNSASGITLRKQGAATWVLTNAFLLGSGGFNVDKGELIVRGAAANLYGARIGVATNGAFTLDGGRVFASALDAVASSVLSFRSGSLTLTASFDQTSAVATGAPFIVGTNGPGAMTLGQVGLFTTGNFNFPSGITIHGPDDTVTLAASTLTTPFLDNSAGGTFSFTGGTLILTGGQLTTASGTLAGIIQGAGGITKTGPGVLTMAAGFNFYSGPTDINQGTLTITGSGIHLMLTRVTVAAGATLDLSASDGQTIGALLGDGTVIVGPGGGAAPGWAGQATTFGGSITGNGNFSKVGSAILALEGSSDHTGSTTVAGGNLSVRAGGGITSTSALVINNGATLTLGDAALGPGSITTDVVDNDNGGTFTWNDGTLRITAASGIRFGTGLSLNKPFGAAYTLSAGRNLDIDGTVTIEGTGALTLAGGTLSTANLDVVAGGTFAFSSGTLRFTMDQTIDAGLAAMADVALPLGPGRTLEVTGTATIATPLVLAGGAMTFGAVVNPDQLILDSGTLTVTTGGLTVADNMTVDLSTGMNVNVGGALDIAPSGQLNLIGANFAAATASANAGQINAIHSTLTFANGLENSGALNLIHSTIDGDVTSTGSTITAAGNTSFDGIIGSDALLKGSIQVQSGANVTAMAVRQKALSLGSGAKLTIAAAGGMSVLDELSIAGDSNPSATFDVNGSGLILRADAATRDAILARTTAQIALARSAGWQGPGIASTAASLEPLTTLAVIINANDDGTPLYDVFNGISVDEHAVLVRYTYNGDADVNGRIDAADFFRLDRGFLSSSNGLSTISYRNGDFSYDGTIDGDDYYLIDTAFLGQAATPGFTAGGAIPEPPALLVPFGWAILMLIGRKGRRRPRCIDEATKGR